MSKLLRNMVSEKLIHPPPWLPDNLVMLVRMGSHAYSCETKDSDLDYIGICIPPKEHIFRLDEIPGFGSPRNRFNEWRQAHIQYNGSEYDFTIYNIVKFFNLALKSNPGVIEVLFARRNLINFSSIEIATCLLSVM